MSEGTKTLTQLHQITSTEQENITIAPGVVSLVLFLEGFVSVSIQMIMLRQLMPFVGYSINTTSIVITLFLAALAFGYKSGGRIKNNHLIKVRSNLLYGGLITGIGMSYVCIAFLLEIAGRIVEGHYYGVAFVSIMVLMPLVYLLAQTVVILIKYRKTGDAAQQAGDTFHISTIGNVAGGLLTTLVVMYYLGVGASIALNASILGVAYVIVSPARKRSSANLTALTMIVITALTNIGFERIGFDLTTGYANYYIHQEVDADTKHLIVNGQDASRSNSNGIGHPYIEHFENLIFNSQNKPNKSVLVLGAGGFTLGRGRLHQQEIIFVDVDKQLRDLSAELYGAKNSIQGKFVAEDARAYLIGTHKQFDDIVIDTFSHKSSVPVHLLTLEFYSLVRSRLKEGGSVHINYIVSGAKISKFQRGIDNTVRAIFGDCSVHRISPHGTVMLNKLYSCRKAASDEYLVIYRDGNTRAAVDSGVE